MSLSGFIRSRLARFLPGTSEPEGPPSLDAESRLALPEGYKEATIGFEDVRSPLEFEAPVPDIACDLCGSHHESYWDWFNHAMDDHGFDDVEEARNWATIIVPIEGGREGDGRRE